MFLLSTWSQSSLLTTQGEFFWLIPKAFLSSVIEWSLQSPEDGLTFILPIFYLWSFSFSLHNKVFVWKKRDLLTVYILQYSHPFPPVGVHFKTWKAPERNGKFPLHLLCSQSVRSDPDKECDIDDDSNKDIFSPHAFLLIRLICGENKWILTKCKRCGVLEGLDYRVWQGRREGVGFKRCLGVKWVHCWGMGDNYPWNEIVWLQVRPKYAVRSE